MKGHNCQSVMFKSEWMRPWHVTSYLACKYLRHLQATSLSWWEHLLQMGPECRQVTIPSWSILSSSRVLWVTFMPLDFNDLVCFALWGVVKICSESLHFAVPMQLLNLSISFLIHLYNSPTTSLHLANSTWRYVKSDLQGCSSASQVTQSKRCCDNY